ncbi:hypothetical protein B0H17DRAFT_1221381 [Mycena rosella]|uniref:Uncharacterized protein n=1 Tax=Mycena rosella TaxID=1033263 RepID=A0AAD7B3Y0_MYCRO|nr:hypothetical protein B0H17DRAFT_1221381 [Mycena rosella]
MLLAKNGHARRRSLGRGGGTYADLPGPRLNHNTHRLPGDATSRLVLKALTSAIGVYPPLNRGHPNSFRAPLKLKLLVEPRVPTVAEFRALADLRVPGPLTDFPREKGAHRPADTAALVALGAEGPVALAWPIVVDWEHKESLVGGVAYMHILEAIAERRYKFIRVPGEKPVSCIRTHARIAVNIPIPTADRTHPEELRIRVSAAVPI